MLSKCGDWRLEHAAVSRLQAQRACVFEPRVARHELSWVRPRKQFQPQRGRTLILHRGPPQPFQGCHPPISFTRGSSCLATPGFKPQSRWDSASPGRMNISAPFIRRPVGTVLLTAAIALAGIVAYLQLPVSPLPQVDFPTISVQANLPGASHEIMASAVAAPLERQLGPIAAVTDMTSASYF